MPEYILGESRAETERLRAQAIAVPVIDRARWAGLTPGMHVVDAGCGPGEIARLFAQAVGTTGAVDAFDMSEARIEAARSRLPLEDGAAIRYAVGDVYKPPVASGSADFVFCQFVFEYLKEPQRALAALVETLKPGGVLCLSDMDGVAGTNWPEPPFVSEGLSRMFAAMAPTGFDPNVGRKLFTWMSDAGLNNVQARVDPIVTAGSATAEDIANWRQRFTGLAPFGERAFGNAAAYEEFVLGFLEMLANPRSLKVVNLVTVSGMRP